MAVILTALPTSLTASTLDRLNAHRLRGLLLYASSFADLAGGAAIRDAVAGRFATGISFAVNQENWQDLPRVAKFCTEQGFSLTLPMQRLYGYEPPFMLTAPEHTQLTEMLAKLYYNALRLTIHDPFLWRAFNPATPFPGGGCQAANTMLAISPDGAVYPCPALPLALGNLYTSTLAELLSSKEKKDVRNMLLQTPEACSVCNELGQCRGGCRGRSYVLQGSICCLDPACDKN